MGIDLDDEVHARILRESPGDVSASARVHALAIAPLLDDGELAGVVAGRVVARIEGLGPLEPLLAEPEVTEVLVNAGTEVWVERRGTLTRTPTDLRPGVAEQLIERIVAPLGLRIDRTSPMVDARLPDGSRVHAVVPPLAVDGACLNIRRFAVRAVPLDAFAPPEVCEVLVSAVDSGANVLVSGPTSSGKTTFLNALCAHLPPAERVITIEDAAELRLPGDHVVRLEARAPTAEGVGGATIRDLLRAALRMRPDRLVIGEVRGAEALDMVQALSTGHDGSFATCHANSALDALRRVESMVLQAAGALPLAAVREQVHASIDLVIHLARGQDGSRRVAEIGEVAPEPADGHDRIRALADHERVVAPLARVPAHGDGRCVVNANAAAVLTFVAFVTVMALVARSRRAVAAAAARAKLGGTPRPFTAPALPRPGARARRARASALALPTVLEDVARALRGGASLHQACREATGVAPADTGLGAVVALADAGVPLAVALRRWPAADTLADRRLAAAALVLAADAGGHQARAIDSVAATVRERFSAAADARAQSAQARLSALVIGLLPLGFAAWASLTDRRSVRFLVASPAGWACLATGAGLEAVGAIWMRRIIRSTTP